MIKAIVFLIIMFCETAYGMSSCCCDNAGTGTKKYSPGILTNTLNNAFLKKGNAKINIITVTNKDKEFAQENLDTLLKNISEKINTKDKNIINIIVFNEMFFLSYSTMEYKDMRAIRDKIAATFKDSNCIVFVNFLYKEGAKRILTNDEAKQIQATSIGKENAALFLRDQKSDEAMTNFYKESCNFSVEQLYFSNESFVLACGETISSYKKSTYCNEYNSAGNSMIYFKGDGQDHIGLYDRINPNFPNEVGLKRLAESIHKYIYTEICYDIMQGVRYLDKDDNKDTRKLHILMAKDLCDIIGGGIMVDTKNDLAAKDTSTLYFPKFDKQGIITVKSDSGGESEEYDRAGVFITTQAGTQKPYRRKHY